jgi:hypothetical protein
MRFSRERNDKRKEEVVAGIGPAQPGFAKMGGRALAASSPRAGFNSIGDAST